MSRNYSNKRRLKYVLLALTCAASFTFTGLAAACKDNTEEDDEQKKTSKEDTQLLKNGNFEFFNVPDKKDGENAPVYLINSPTSWTHGGTSSYTMSGIIGTSETAWGKITEPKTDTSIGIIEKLNYNNNLDSSANNYKTEYVDYNGMKASDLLYKNSYNAIKYDEDKDKDEDDKVLGDITEDEAKKFIENPGTHYNVQKKADGKLFYTDGDTETEVFEDENGDYFFDKEFKKPFSHVLMLHNYATDHNGISQKYTSVSVDLPANTAAEISVWVKTNYLYFSQGKTVSQDRGANITVTQTIGSTTIDPLVISCINTEKINPKPESGEWKNNGWVEYTVYVNACDFASSTISIELGLGESNYNVEGYAFFDDVSVKKLGDLDDGSYKDNKDKIHVVDTANKIDADAKCSLASEKDEKVFKADTYERNGELLDGRFSKNFHYLVDLASRAGHEDVIFEKGETPVTAGLTSDADNYVSSDKLNATVSPEITKKNSGTRLPKDFKAIDTSSDLLLVQKAGEQFTGAYAGRLNDALLSAKDLPNVNGATDNNLLVMLSAYGAAYTSSFTLSIEGETNTIVSFWVKTSDMNGSTAATIKITQNGKKANTSSITLDSTNKSTDIGTEEDEKDIFNGWVQCFFFVKNETEEKAHYTVDFSFGNTTIKDTKVNAYKAGWVALANMQTMADVDKKIFGYTGSGDYSASLTITEDEQGKTSVFDEAYGSQKHEIENDMVTPSTYKGVNGGSSSIVNNGHVSIPFDDFNKNENAGLINKEFFDNYADKTDWYAGLLNKFDVSDTSASAAVAAWEKIFGKTSIQPLLIVNKERNDYVVEKGLTQEAFEKNPAAYYIKDDDGYFEKLENDAKFDEEETYYSLKEVLNYGFIGSDKTVSANSYATVSVKVKVSKGAIAYVYLTNTDAGKKVVDFGAPVLSFFYDVDGNVLKAEPQSDWSHTEQVENVLYRLRDDGLYEDNDGKLFANTHNLIETYVNDEVKYFDEDGNEVLFDRLVKGESYYDSADKSTRKLLNHFLENTEGVRVFEYKDGNYYYIVDNKTQETAVTPFNKDYARYNFTDVEENEMMVKIDGNEAGVAGKWVTVNFILHAGSASKGYRLELWSGEREKTFTDGNTENGVVLFDYSYTNITDDALMKEYENEVIREYRKLLIDKVENFDSSSENISYYEKLAEKLIAEGKLNKSDIDGNEVLKNYVAHYYTYSFYDSEAFRPFNKNTADETELGYNYSVNDYSESLAYFKVVDENTISVFADYATVDQTITMNTVDGEEDDNTEDEETTDSSVWLLVSSILLVIAMLFAMISLMVRDLLKKKRRNKVYGKNTVKTNQANRYMKKLGVQKEEIEEIEPENVAEVEPETKDDGDEQ